MVFLELLENAVVLLILAFFITQILIPMWKGTPKFPSFRPKAKKLEEELGKAKEEVENAVIEKEIVETKEKATKIKPKPKEDIKNGTKSV